MNTGTIAPHEHCEVQLVLGGLKPLAVLERDKSPYSRAFAYSLASAGLLFHYTDRNGDVIITKPGNRLLVDEYLDLLLHGVDRYGLKEYHRKMGRLFGYGEEICRY